MPELPEVETVRKVLKKKLLNEKIIDVKIFYDKIIETNLKDFANNIKGQSIIDINRIGKFLIFELNDYYLVSHLRMEGKFFIKDKKEYISKHEHVIFLFNNFTLRYHDTRKFGKMYLVDKDKLYTDTPLKNIGVEPFNLDYDYLKDKFKRRISIKTLLLDQSIISGIGNIYANEILFASSISPYKLGINLNKDEINNIIKYSKEILNKAINYGGTTIRSYTSSLGVYGNYQDFLMVHSRENLKCYKCNSLIKKDEINGRGTYYCPNCQKEDNE